MSNYESLSKSVWFDFNSRRVILELVGPQKSRAFWETQLHLITPHCNQVSASGCARCVVHTRGYSAALAFITVTGPLTLPFSLAAAAASPWHCHPSTCASLSHSRQVWWSGHDERRSGPLHHRGICVWVCVRVREYRRKEHLYVRQ